jgi:glycerophosphoryl diester phosphodiesterase
MKPPGTEWTVFAHRGASGTEPENTLRAFRRALEVGAGWIELDVQAVGGRLLVFHDNRLERTTDGTGKLSNASLEILRTLDAGGGERIPFLEEVLDLVGGRAGINIELKGRSTASIAVPLIRTCLRQGPWTADHFLLSSFRETELETARRMDPDLRLGLLVRRLHPGALAFAHRLDAYSVHLPRFGATPRAMGAATGRGMKTFVFTVNEPEGAERMRSRGAAGVFTDFPERLIDSPDALGEGYGAR